MYRHLTIISSKVYNTIMYFKTKNDLSTLYNLDYVMLLLDSIEP